MKSQIFILALFAAAVAVNGETAPVTKVVNMLKDMQARIVADGEREAKIMGKFSCWCKDATARKASDIHEAEDELRSLGQDILKFKGKVATLQAEIEDLAEQLGANADGMEETTAIRQRRNGKFMAMQSETKQEMAALEKAIKVLKDGTSLLQADSAARAMSAVQSVLEKIPLGLGAPLNEEHMSFLSEFVTDGASGKYAPQSATIQGMLTNMYTTFAANLEDATMTEAKQNKDFENYAHSSAKAAAKANDVKSRKEAEQAKAETDLADTTETYDSTMAQMKANINFFDTSKKACEDKYAESQNREKARAAEKKGIDKALELLTSDKARDLFAASIKPGVGLLEAGTSFLQTASNEDAQAVAFKTYGTLKTLAKKTKSLRLAMLAVHVRSATAGHFDEVVKSIDGMVATLNTEGDNDRKQRDECKTNYQSIASDSAEYQWDIKNNEAEIEKFTKAIERRQEEKAQAQSELKNAEEYRAKITADRKQEHADFQTAKKDDTAAINLLTQAKNALTAYYKKNKIDVGAIQIAQAEPEFEVSKDQAPDASLSSNDNNQGQASGIVALMDYIIEDLQDEVANGAKDERQATAEYLEALASGKELEADLKDKITGLAGVISSKEDKKTSENKDLKKSQKNLKGELDFKAKISTDCDWIIKNFDGRATARAAEMDGLVAAKQKLSSGGSALLQLKAPVEANKGGKDKLANIRFLGLQ